MSIILDTIITECEKSITSIDRSTLRIDTDIANLEARKSDIEDEIIDVTVADINTILEAKGDEVKGYYVYTWGEYGVKNVTEFRVYDLTFDGNVTYISDSSFSVVGDQTAIFLEPVLEVPQTYIRAYIDNSLEDPVIADTYVYTTVKTAVYSSPNTTIVIEDGTTITSNIEDVYTDVYNYGDDTDIDSLKTDFDFAVDYIYSNVTELGTYGVDPNITNLTASKAYVGTNKTNYTDAIAILERYST